VRGFLQTFFQNLALLTVAEFLASNDTEQHSTWHVIQQIFQAEDTLLLRQESLFASVYHVKPGLFGAIGILLAPQFVVEKQGKHTKDNFEIDWNRLERIAKQGYAWLGTALGGVRHLLVPGLPLQADITRQAVLANEHVESRLLVLLVSESVDVGYPNEGSSGSAT
jgi:hypothetical protein